MILKHLFPADLRERVDRSLAGVDRPEFGQAVLRVFIGGLVMLYLFWYALQDGTIDDQEFPVLCVSVGFFLFGAFLIAAILILRDVSVTRRYLAMVADNFVTTYCLYQMGEGGAVIIGVYLLITFGNGLRYGPKYLHVCQALGLVGFGFVLTYSEFWSKHIAIGLGFLIGLLVLPIYVSHLTGRIRAARRRADAASVAKSRFVANVSHEMRTPLNGVIAMADILRETDLGDSQREIVETLSTSAELLLAQIEDVLDLAKIEAGRVQIELRPFDLTKLLSSAVRVIVPQARYKGLVVATEIPPDAGGWYLGDPHHLRQVILNLLSNAVKFTQKGEIRLRARAASTPGSGIRKVRIEVSDTGIGIPESKLAAIFEPFTQADDSVTRVYGGTGLGTTIARHLVELMGGSIGVESQEAVGTTFWVELPLEVSAPAGIDLVDASLLPRFGAAKETVKAGAHSNVHKLRRARILVAEDNATNQRVAQLILESGGHTVTIVDNGEHALDALERGGFDIALFDLSMPVVSGLEALKLYRFACSSPIPVLIVSANVTTEVIAEVLDGGAAEFVPKPLRASILLDAVDRHLSHSLDAATEPPPRLDERASLTLVETPVLDVSVLEDLSRLSSDPTFMNRLLRGFRADTERLVRELLGHLARREYEKVRDVAHALKGGAASVGASQLAQQAVSLEKVTAETLRVRSAAFIEEITRTSTRTIEELERALERFDQSAAKDDKLGS